MRDGPLKPEMLQELRNLEDKVVLRASASLRSSVTTVKLLVEINSGLKKYDKRIAERSVKIHHSLAAILNRLSNHLNNAEVLEKRIHATIGLVSFSPSASIGHLIIGAS